MDEKRPLAADERAILDWFFDEWAELALLQEAVSPEAVADVFTADDGYRTISLAWATVPSALPAESPFPGEAEATIEGKHFNAMLFTNTEGLMLEMIWNPEWPGRLPTRAELRRIRTRLIE
ncbi:MAG: hypothetical protein ACJ768_22395 [Gaiellaceae bacterium]